MRISDWSSDVCSSDLATRSTIAQPQQKPITPTLPLPSRMRSAPPSATVSAVSAPRSDLPIISRALSSSDRKSVVQGKSVSVRVELGGRRFIKNKSREDEVKKESVRELSSLINK